MDDMKLTLIIAKLYSIPIVMRYLQCSASVYYSR